MTSPEKLRIGIIGANSTRGWAARSHLPALQALEDIELSAVATTRQESADATASAFGARHAFSDPRLLVESDDVDVVSICVKVWYHYELTKLALQAGKHVFTEWPLGANLEQARELTALADDQGVLHMIGLQGRKSPLINYVRDLVADGYVGRVLSATLAIASSGRGGTRIPAERVWSSDKTHGATLLTIVGGHSLDVLRYVLGEFASLSAIVATQDKRATVIDTGETIEVTSPDNVLLTGTLESGTVVAARFLSTSKSSETLFEINGDEGALRITGSSGLLHLADLDLTLSGCHGLDSMGPLAIPERYQLVPPSVPAGAAINVAALYLALADAIRAGTSVEPSFTTALQLHELIEAIERSSLTGQRQQLADVLSPQA